MLSFGRSSGPDNEPVPGIGPIGASWRSSPPRCKPKLNGRVLRALARRVVVVFDRDSVVVLR